jgi:hypothetical protein
VHLLDRLDVELVGKQVRWTEAYALRVMDEVWPAYLRRFGL